MLNHGHHIALLVAQVCVEGAVASPCSVPRYCCSQNSSRSSSRYANFILLGNSGRFLVVPIILCNSSEEIRTQHHRRHVVCVHVVLHLSLTRKMQFLRHKPPRLWQVATRKLCGVMQRPMWRYEQLFIFSVGVWLSRRGDERKMPSMDAQFIVSKIGRFSVQRILLCNFQQA